MPESATLVGLIKFVIDWARIHQALIGWLSVLSMIMFFGTLLVIPMMVIRIPEDYFLYDREHLRQYRRMHPVIYFLTVVLKNILGIVFILAGIVMLVLPGQGILTILIGLTLISFPRKRALELRFIRQESVHKALDWIRVKAGKSRLRIP